MNIQWPEIISQFLHKSFGNITGVKGFIELYQNASEEKQREYTEKIFSSLQILEDNMRELDMLHRDVSPEMALFDFYEIIEKCYSRFQQLSFEQGIKRIIDEKWFAFKGDPDLSEQVLSLLARILISNKIPHSEIRVTIKGDEIVFERIPFKNKYLDSIDGPWGYEKTLLLYLLESIDWKLSHGLSGDKEYIHLNPFRRYNGEI